MSGITGIFHLDGSPVAHGPLEDMTAALAHRGPDGMDRWVSGPVGLGHCMLRTTAQAVHESQPLRDESGELCLVLDGRVDNREELRRALGPRSRHLRDDSDAELVLQAYRHWGSGCVDKIIGDFALALWHGRRRELLCARDFLGKRPFYYYFDGSSFRFASEPQAVMADSSVPREPNQGMIAEFLANAVTSTTETLFRHLFRLPPAHFMVVSFKGLELTRYWDWDPERVVRYHDDRDYAAHFRQLLATATEVRLQSPWPVAAELSGGVDSSSLISLAEYLRTTGRYNGRLEAYSMVFPGRDCDETLYIREVARYCDMPVHEFRPGPAGEGPYLAQVQQYLDLPDYPNMMMHRTHWVVARQRDCRVVLTGQGGDQWFEGSLYSYSDSLRRLRLGRLVADLRVSVKASGWRASTADLFYYGLKPLLPPALVESIHRLAGQAFPPAWLDESFCRDISLAERIRTPTPNAPSFATGDIATRLIDGFETHANEFADRAIASTRQEHRDPFDDRRVVEFALALPEDQRRRGGLTKYVLRSAMAGLMPESVRSRRNKAEFSHVFYEELRVQGGLALFTGTVLEDLGWIDGKQVRAMYEQIDRWYRSPDGSLPRHLWSLWTLASVERWLRVMS